MCSALVMSFSVASHAKTLAGVTMPDTKMVGGVALKLNGLGMREATMFKVDVYVAGLYVEKTSASAKELLEATGPKELVLKFVRNVSAADLSGAWKEGLEKNGGGKAIAAKVEHLNAMM